ncbi:MAG: cohesin domain-containing protein [Patescibacteria group bacterium]
MRMKSSGKTIHIFNALYALLCFAIIASTALVAVAATTSVVIGGAATATLALSPASGSYATGDIVSVNILLNTQSNPIQGVDIVYLNYNPTLLEVQDDDAVVAINVPGAQIAPGTLMATTALNSVDTVAGKIAFSQVTTSGVSYTGSGTLATVRFKALASGTATVTFNVTQGSTIDTNVASDGEDVLASASGGSYVLSGTAVPPQQDMTPPVRANGAPSGVLAVGTTQAALSLTTNESATCRYITSAGVSYTGMTSAFTTTGTTSHSVTITGLSNGSSYTYYMRCTDGAGIANTDDYTITFSVALPTSAPAPAPTPAPTSGGSYTPPAAVTPAPSSTITQTATPVTGTASPYLPSGVMEGDLVRGPDGIKVYIVNYHGYRRHIFNPAVFGMYGHFKWDAIKSLSQQEIDTLKTSDLYRADGDARVFALHELDEKKGLAQKRWMNMTGERFATLGYKWEQVFVINTKERDYYQEGSPITDTQQSSAQPSASVVSIIAGSLVKAADNPTVYYITSTGLKKRIPSAAVFNAYNNKWENVKTVSQSQLDAYATVNTIKLSGSAKVYLLEGDTKRWVKTSTAFARLGLDWNKVATVNQAELSAYAEGAAIE